METINHFIGGSVAEGSGTRYADVYNPALGTVARHHGDCAELHLSGS